MRSPEGPGRWVPGKRGRTGQGGRKISSAYLLDVPKGRSDTHISMQRKLLCSQISTGEVPCESRLHRVFHLPGDTLSVCGWSCSTLCDPWTVAASLWASPGKNTGVGCSFLLQGILLTQGSNLGLLHYRQIRYYLSHWDSKCT